MANFSFDIVSEYDKAEINNVLASVQREIANRYDFKNTPAAIEWLGDKAGYKITATGDWQLDTILDIVRKNLANRGQSSKFLDLTKPIISANLKVTQEIPFVEGLDKEKSKEIIKFLKDAMPKLKAQIQGEAVRVQSSSKDDLQAAMSQLKQHDFNFVINFTNYR